VSVSVIYSLTNGGVEISSALDHGDMSNGDISSAQTIYLRHDGANPITSAGIFIRQYSGRLVHRPISVLQVLANQNLILERDLQD